MDSSRRAVKSYWRSRMIDGATSDEDKVTPVYKLEEICEPLRSSHVSIVKEVSEFILKRLEHKSPIVKQKALRLIKYAVVKSGAEFRREMQRNSVAVRQLLHYKGQLDPLKGDAPNKAVRETAQEAISAIFSEDNNYKPAAPADYLNKRIQGFGNKNYEMPSEDKKTFLSEVVGIGSASLKQGLSSFTQGNSHGKNDNGSYKSPTLRRSLTVESDYSDRYEPVELRNDAQSSFGTSKPAASGPWGQDSRVVNTETVFKESVSNSSETKTREERLLETIVTSGGVRLQPTRDAILAFLVEAAKLDVLSICHALESKLESPMWQVRMKAVCVLEALLRRKEDGHFSVVASYFTENQDVLIRCSESPQASLRDKATRVLSLVNGGQGAGLVSNSEKTLKAETNSSVHMPDLIDTGDSDDYFGIQDSSKKLDYQIAENPIRATPLIDYLFGDVMGNGLSTTEQKTDDDPFADVSFHTGESKENVDDLFSGMTIDDKLAGNGNNFTANEKASEPFDIFGITADVPLEKETHNSDGVNDLVAGLSTTEKSSNMKQKGTLPEALSGSIFADMNTHASNQTSSDPLHGILSSQTAGMNANPMYPVGDMPYNLSAGMMLNQAFTSQTINYAAMGDLLAQQQFLATMSNLQHLANLNMQNAGSIVSGTNGRYSSALPDIFQPNFSIQNPTSMMNTSKKEDTTAFDFISDHLAATRDGKRVL